MQRHHHLSPRGPARRLWRALPLLGLLATASLTGCGEAVLTQGEETIREASHAEAAGELMYLRDRAEVTAGFADGLARFVPSQTWTAADLVLATDDPSTLTWRAEYADGTASPWAPLPALVGEAPHVATVLNVDRPAQALRLRGPGALDFARLEFFAERRPEGAHPGHDDDPQFAEDHDDATALTGSLAEKAARAGRWLPPANGGDRYVPYTGAPSWSGGRNCSGSLTAGARALGRYLVENFAGARSFQGYACRQIRGSSGMSVHGTGRALDIFVPLDRGAADNDLGDPIGDWLIANADQIGIQLVIWDRTIWSGSRRAGSKARYYSGAHPHHDHLHIELTPDAARQRTPFFGGRVAAPAAPANRGPADCNSQTLGRRVPDGQCVQMAYERCGGTCNWARCTDGTWQCTEVGDCSELHGNGTCGPPPARTPDPAPAPDPDPAPAPEPAPEPDPRASCYSRTLSADVPDGQCVQMAYDACGGTCRWARCDDGDWACDTPSGGATRHGHARCR